MKTRLERAAEAYAERWPERLPRNGGFIAGAKWMRDRAVTVVIEECPLHEGLRLLGMGTVEYLKTIGDEEEHEK